MIEIETVLATYEDFELAFMYKYKLDQYLEPTREVIKKYISKRGLDDFKMEALIEVQKTKVYPDDGVERCPRCKSSKINIDDEPYYNTNVRGGDPILMDAPNPTHEGGFSGKLVNVGIKTCDVCGFRLNDPNNEYSKSIWNRIEGMFSRKKD